MRSILPLCLVLLLSGCSEPPEGFLHDYSYRVGNAIEQPFDLGFTTKLPSYPAKRLRSLEVEPIREGLLDVLDLRRCGLMELIGERNSSLGKLALPSQRLIYETRFLPPLRACISRLAAEQNPDEETQSLLQRLRHIETIKQTNYPRVVSNALFNSDEISQHFAMGGQPLSTTHSLASLQMALEHQQYLADMARQAHWDSPNWIGNLEKDYAAFYRSRFGTDWLYSLVLLTQTLDQTAAAIETRLARRPVCFNKTPTPQARIIRNVFQRYYAGELQPWMSVVDRNGRLWRQHWLDLLEHLPTTEAVQDYFNQVLAATPGSLWQSYIDARDRHTHAWQQLLSQCGMMPGKQ